MTHVSWSGFGVATVDVDVPFMLGGMKLQTRLVVRAGAKNTLEPQHPVIGQCHVSSTRTYAQTSSGDRWTPRGLRLRRKMKNRRGLRDETAGGKSPMRVRPRFEQACTYELPRQVSSTPTVVRIRVAARHDASFDGAAAFADSGFSPRPQSRV